MTEQRLEAWLDECYPTSFRAACLILGNRADAEEAVQEAFLRAWRFRASLASVVDIKPWLYRVVVNASYSKLRREIPARDHRAGEDPLDHMAMDSLSDPEAEAERSDAANNVVAALRRLPMSLRVPVVLRYYAELSEKEIAQAIGRRPGTVKSRLHEARRRLANDPDLQTLVGTIPLDQLGTTAQSAETAT